MLETEEKFDTEAVEVGGVPHLKITFFKEQSRKGVVIRHSEGWELHDLKESKDILEAENGRVKHLESTRTKKVMLLAEDQRIIKSQERIKKSQEYNQKKMQMGAVFDDLIKKEEEGILREKKMQALWREGLGKLERAIENKESIPEPDSSEGTPSDGEKEC